MALFLIILTYSKIVVKQNLSVLDHTCRIMAFCCVLGGPGGKESPANTSVKDVGSVPGL